MPLLILWKRHICDKKSDKEELEPVLCSLCFPATDNVWHLSACLPRLQLCNPLACWLERQSGDTGMYDLPVTARSSSWVGKRYRRKSTREGPLATDHVSNVLYEPVRTSCRQGWGWCQGLHRGASCPWPDRRWRRHRSWLRLLPRLSHWCCYHPWNNAYWPLWPLVDDRLQQRRNCGIRWPPTVLASGAVCAGPTPALHHSRPRRDSETRVLRAGDHLCTLEICLPFCLVGRNEWLEIATIKENDWTEKKLKVKNIQT